MTKIYCLLYLFLLYSAHSHAQDTNERHDSTTIYKKIAQKAKQFVRELDNMDEDYISPNYYNWTVMLQNSNYGEKYKISNGRQTIEFAPNFTYRIGGYVGWHWVFLGYSFDVSSWFNKKYTAPKKDFQFSLYSSMLGGDIYYRKTNSNFTIKSVTNVFEDGKTKLNNVDFSGLDISMKGINVYYIFNSKRFSYPAAFAQSTNQRRSAGTFKLGFMYSDHKVKFDVKAMPEPILSHLDTASFYNSVKYRDYALTFGYAYNWVFAKNWLACLSVDPAIGIKQSTIKSEKKNDPFRYFFRNVNFDVVTRAAVVWNNSKYYAGASLVTNTYDYRKTAFTLTSSFGTLNVYVGMNFAMKKKYRKEKQKQKENSYTPTTLIR